MPSNSKDSKFLFIALAAVAAAGLVYVMWQENEKESPEKVNKELPEEKEHSGKAFNDQASQSTTKDSNTGTANKVVDGDKMDEKALHSKIEELDKKGKAYFKNKQVRPVQGAHNS